MVGEPDEEVALLRSITISKGASSAGDYLD